MVKGLLKLSAVLFVCFGLLGCPEAPSTGEADGGRKVEQQDTEQNKKNENQSEGSGSEDSDG